MIILNIVEWIVNLLILGLTGIVWIVVAFGLMMFFSIATRTIKEFVGAE